MTAFPNSQNFRPTSASWPELLPLIPVVHADVLDTMEVAEGELGRLLPEFMKLGAATRRDTDVRADADALLQALGTQR